MRRRLIIEEPSNNGGRDRVEFVCMQMTKWCCNTDILPEEKFENRKRTAEMSDPEKWIRKVVVCCSLVDKAKKETFREERIIT